MHHLADADRPGELLDGNVPLEHPLDHIHDQQGVLPGISPGTQPSESLNESCSTFAGGSKRAEAQVICLGAGAVARVGQLGCDCHWKMLPIAQHIQRGGLPFLVGEIQQQRRYGTDLRPSMLTISSFGFRPAPLLGAARGQLVTP